MWNTIVGGRAVPANSISSEAAQHHMAPTLPQRPPRPLCLFGTRTAITGNAKIASAGVKKFVIFVGKIDKDTSEDDLVEFLEENDISGAEVRKLPAKHEWQQKSSAFRVAVPYRLKDELLNTDLWPDSVEIREWFFKPTPVSRNKVSPRNRISA